VCGNSGDYALSTVYGVEKGLVESAFQLGASRYAASFRTQCSSFCSKGGEVEIQVPCIALRFVVLEPPACCVLMGAYELSITGLDIHDLIASRRRSHPVCCVEMRRRQDRMSLT
jgi:hypothetical protein